MTKSGGQRVTKLGGQRVTESGRRAQSPAPPGPSRSHAPSSAPPRDSRPRFTGRAAIVAVFSCAIVLSLAYPVREYIAERRQIDELEVQRAQIARQLSRLEAERQRLRDPAYVEQLARDRLHMCLPNQMCYVVIDPAARSKVSAAPKHVAEPWYAKLWSSVQLADGQPSPRPHQPGRRSPVRHVAAGE